MTGLSELKDDVTIATEKKLQENFSFEAMARNNAVDFTGEEEETQCPEESSKKRKIKNNQDKVERGKQKFRTAD